MKWLWDIQVKENSTNIVEIKAWEIYRTMRGCILGFNHDILRCQHYVCLLFFCLRHLLHTCIGDWRKFHAESDFLLLFGHKKRIAVKSSLELYFSPLIIEGFFICLRFRIEEKIHIKAVADMSRSGAGRIFPNLFCLWEGGK